MPGPVPARDRGGHRRQTDASSEQEQRLTEPRRVVCAPNAFKGTLTARAAADAMASGVRSQGALAETIPVADGGDGTLDVLLETAGAPSWTTTHSVTGPLGAPVEARLGWLDEGTAVVELAEASGLRLISRAKRDALTATSRGAGELLAAALDAGAARVIVGVGGSASTDGGAGLLQALGARLLDAAGNDLGPGGGELTRLEHIEMNALHAGLRLVNVEVAADVRNPLAGPDGAAAVFGPQKGASAAEVEVLDAGLRRLASVAERDIGAAGVADRPGTGAAGGAAFGLALAGATLLPGAALVCDQLRLQERIAGADLVVTGEGRLDAQTAMGKAPFEVAERAKRASIPCAVIAGSVLDPLAGMFARVLALEDMAEHASAMRGAASLLERAASQLTQELLQ